MRAATASGPARDAPGARPRFRMASPGTATALALTLLLLAAAVIPLSLLAQQSLLANVIQLLTGIPISIVGFIVARRQPGNPIGWLLLAVPIGILLSLDAGPYAWLVYRLGYQLPLGPVAVLLDSAYFPVLFIALPPVFLLFPDGVLPARRWRWVLRAYLAVAGGLIAALYATEIIVMATHGVHLDASGNLAALDHASGPAAWLFAHAGVLIGPPVLAFWLVFAGRLLLSWRRARGDRRQQLKWLMSGAVVAMAGLLLSNLVPVLDPTATVVGVALVLPACLGVAILRYRLYDIDRIISRTLAYAIVTGLLIGLYAGLVLLATQVLQIRGPVTVAVATLAAAALFSPLRRRVQRAVDRRFNRSKYDADETVATFAARLKDATDLDAVRDDLTGVVSRVLEPAHVSVWINRPG
jgi:hypothetical protein